VKSAGIQHLVAIAKGERRIIEDVFNKMEEWIRKIKVGIDNHQISATIAQ